MIAIPEVGKYYWHYDDGKIRPSRQEIVQITKVLSYSELSKEIRNMIKKEIEDHDWLYEDVIHTVVFAENKTMQRYDDTTCELIYLPFKHGGWYGFGIDNGWNQGMLDVDGELTKSINECDFFKDTYNFDLFPNLNDIEKVLKKN